MSGRRLIPLALSLGALALPGVGAAAEPPAPPTPAPAFVPGKVIVEWAPGAGHGDKVAAREEAEVAYESSLGDPSFQLVQVESGQSVAGAIEELRADPAVSVAERDGYAAPTALPNDPLFADQWALQNFGTGIDGFSGAVAGDDIDALDAWQKTIGSPEVVVADIDSGYRFDSPDLGPVAWENPGEIAGNGIDDDGDGYVDDVHGWDFVGEDSEAPTEDADPTDSDLISGGHGVHTAGIIGAAGDNGVGITGVAQDARIMPLRVCSNAPSINELRCPISSTIAAINYAGHEGARVGNLSLTGTSSSTAELDAFAENPRTLFVIAAGNDAQDNGLHPHYPCDYEPGTTAISGATENIVCVAATDQADGLASFSDWGQDTVDLGAPGTQILSTYPAFEEVVGDDFEAEDFATRWKTIAVEGGFERTDEAPLTSFGISDSPGRAPVANSVRASQLTTPVPVPAEDGACTLTGLDSVLLAGGSFKVTIFKNRTGDHTFSLPSTTAAGMSPFRTVPMTDLAGSNVGLRLTYTAGSAPTAAAGAWVDDLSLSCYAPLSTPPTYEYLQGTSMAAPQVSGAAALLFSEKPGASVEEVSDALISSVDPVPSLAGKTVSGGRLDAARALAWLEPPAPVLTSDPISPAEDDLPRITGTVAAGTQVLLFEDDRGCVGSPSKTGTAAEFESPGFTVKVPPGARSRFTAIAETKYNSSPCSQSLLYVDGSGPVDETAPEPPVLSSTNPSSPGNTTHPTILGSAEAGSTVAIYEEALCGGSAVAMGSAEELASSGIAVTVPEREERQFWATATDASENVSECSEPISFDDIGPKPLAAPVLTGTSPASPAASGDPSVFGQAEAESWVRIYAGAGCTGQILGVGSAKALISPGIELNVEPESTVELSATATDAAGNTSPCSTSLTYTNTQPFLTFSFPLNDKHSAESTPSAPPPAAQTTPCTVPKLAGKTLAQAKAALKRAECALGKVAKPKGRTNRGAGALVVHSSTPPAGTKTASGVSLRLAPQRAKQHGAP